MKMIKNKKILDFLSYRVGVDAVSVVRRWGQRPVGPAQVQVQRGREGGGGRGRRFGGGKRVRPEVVEGGFEGAVGRVAGRGDAWDWPHCENNFEAFLNEVERGNKSLIWLVFVSLDWSRFESTWRHLMSERFRLKFGLMTVLGCFLFYCFRSRFVSIKKYESVKILECLSRTLPEVKS